MALVHHCLGQIFQPNDPSNFADNHMYSWLLTITHFFPQLSSGLLVSQTKPFAFLSDNSRYLLLIRDDTWRAMFGHLNIAMNSTVLVSATTKAQTNAAHAPSRPPVRVFTVSMRGLSEASLGGRERETEEGREIGKKEWKDKRRKGRKNRARDQNYDKLRPQPHSVYPP